MSTGRKRPVTPVHYSATTVGLSAPLPLPAKIPPEKLHFQSRAETQNLDSSTDPLGAERIPRKEKRQ